MLIQSKQETIKDQIKQYFLENPESSPDVLALARACGETEMVEVFKDRTVFLEALWDLIGKQILKPGQKISQIVVDRGWKKI